MAQTAVKYGDPRPMATVCCNACRTCVQTNVLGLALAAVAGTGAAAAGVARRVFRRERVETHVPS